MEMIILDWSARLSFSDQIHLALALAATGSMLLNFGHLEPNLKVICFFCLARFAAEFSPDNTPLPHTEQLPALYRMLYANFNFISYAILAGFFYLTFIRKRLKIQLLLSIPLFWLLDKVPVAITKLEPVYQYSSLANVTECVLVTYWCFSYFMDVLDHHGMYGPENDRTFWLVVIFLLYFIASFFITGLPKFSTSTDETLERTFSFAGYALKYLLNGVLIFVSLVKFPRNSYERI